ncbi:MAG: LysR family transcriptional regulator [Eubacterium sp.]|nr:LysR family transcriptional regulator [Eubacterium sp.]
MIDNLNYYRVFYTVAHTESISKAAERLFISQPAVSKSISNLEETLGTKLFSRGSRGVTLTEEGQILYDHLRNAFDMISKAEDELHHINELGIGELRLGISTSLCRYILMPYLKSFIAENPHVKLTIDCHSTYNTIRQLQDGNIDVGFICETNLPPDYIYEPFREVHDIFVASDSYLHNLSVRESSTGFESQATNNPWLMAGNVTSLVDDHAANDIFKDDFDPDFSNGETMSSRNILERSNLMLLEKSNITRKHIDRYFYDNEINPGQILEINNMDLLIDFASIGMGVSAIVKEFAEEQLNNGTVVELELASPIPPRTVGFVYKRGLDKLSPTSRLIDMCF